jgi:hypothetical protein
VASLLASDAALAITYDPGWLELWRQRFADPLVDAETFRIDNVGLERPEPLAPCVLRLLADLVPLRNRWDPVAICLADDRNHLLFREPRLAHAPLSEGQSLT